MTTSRSIRSVRLATLAFAVVMSAGTVFAASSPGTPAPMSHAGSWRHGPEHMFDKLGLSAEQKASVKSIFDTDGKRLQDLRVQMRTNMEKLHQTKPDDPTYDSLVSQVAKDNGALTTQVISAQGAMHARLYAVLTPAQKTQLAGMEARMRERMKQGEHRRHHGPGQDGGPPPDARPDGPTE
ncbi:MAG: periplasmic heavy metal sensor [Proteobacteria bacterium]|nr:periplasmic heavy metal sensor [Pseudomonadota bacterium]